MTYHVDFSPRARKEVRALPKEVGIAVREAAYALASDPRPAGCKKLAGGTNTYRLRVGSYRLIYDINDGELIVLVVRASPRREAYRGLNDLLKSLRRP